MMYSTRKLDSKTRAAVWTGAHLHQLAESQGGEVTVFASHGHVRGAERFGKTRLVIIPEGGMAPLHVGSLAIVTSDATPEEVWPADIVATIPPERRHRILVGR